jgi:hypothetical protein
MNGLARLVQRLPIASWLFFRNACRNDNVLSVLYGLVCDRLGKQQISRAAWPRKAGAFRVVLFGGSSGSWS